MNLDSVLIEELARVFANAAVRELEKQLSGNPSGYFKDNSTNKGGSTNDVHECARSAWPRSTKHRD